MWYKIVVETKDRIDDTNIKVCNAAGDEVDIIAVFPIGKAR